MKVSGARPHLGCPVPSELPANADYKRGPRSALVGTKRGAVVAEWNVLGYVISIS